MSERLLITSAQNPRIKATAALRDRKEREQTGLILVEGAREIERALASGLNPTSAYVCEELATRIPKLVEVLDKRLGAQRVSVAPHVFDKLAVRDGSDGVVVTFERPRTSLEMLVSKPLPLILAVHGVEKPGNLGALLRTADGAGASGVVVLEASVDPFAPQSIRGSLGTVFSQPVVNATSEALRDLCARHGITIVAAALTDRSTLPWEVDFKGPTCVLLGAESTGLPAAWLAPPTRVVKIPMLGLADSLNVAAAGAMLLYEAVRQRHLR